MRSRRTLAGALGPFFLCPKTHNHYDKQLEQGASQAVATMCVIGGCVTIEIAYESQEEDI
jgi:hypothetical protein